jgi:hypothetical protein
LIFTIFHVDFTRLQSDKEAEERAKLEAGKGLKGVQ